MTVQIKYFSDVTGLELVGEEVNTYALSIPIRAGSVGKSHSYQWQFSNAEVAGLATAENALLAAVQVAVNDFLAAVGSL